MVVKKGFRAWADKARLASQLAFLLIFAVLISGAICVFVAGKASALEPVGFLQMVAASIRNGDFTLSALAIGGTLVFLAAFIVFGGAFCGWACPVGAVSDLAGRLRKPSKIRPKDKTVKAYFANIPTRETIALSVIGASFATGSIAWCPICPIGGICRSIGLNGLVGGAEIAAFAAVPAVSEAKSPRWFCKWLCPVGGTISGLRKYISPTFKLKVNEDVCTECDICFRDCPYDLKPYREDDLNRCIMCLKCYQGCPYNEKGIQIQVKAW
jgi:ferredoxin-type protein NapH